MSPFSGKRKSLSKLKHTQKRCINIIHIKTRTKKNKHTRRKKKLYKSLDIRKWKVVVPDCHPWVRVRHVRASISTRRRSPRMKNEGRRGFEAARSFARTRALLLPQQVRESHHGPVHLTLIARNRDCGQWMFAALPRNDSLAARVRRPRSSPRAPQGEGGEGREGGGGGGRRRKANATTREQLRNFLRAPWPRIRAASPHD